MNFIKSVILIFTLNIVLNVNSFSQELAHHKWEDRLILILSDNGSSTLVNKQLKELKQSEDGLKERKLMIYAVYPDGYQTVFPDTSSWKNSNNLYKNYKQFASDFEIMLIGLDGGVKLCEAECLSAEEIFSVIDKMYMRKREIENNIKN